MDNHCGNHYRVLFCALARVLVSGFAAICRHLAALIWLAAPFELASQGAKSRCSAARIHQVEETGFIMLSRSVLKIWAICWFSAANLWFPWLAGGVHQKDAERE